MAYDDMKGAHAIRFGQIDCPPAPGNPLGVRQSEIAEELDRLRGAIGQLRDETGNVLDRLHPIMHPDFPVAQGPEETNCTTELGRQLQELRHLVDKVCGSLVNARERLEL